MSSGIIALQGGEDVNETADSEPISAAQLIKDLTEGMQELSEATGRPTSFAEIARRITAANSEGEEAP